MNSVKKEKYGSEKRKYEGLKKDSKKEGKREGR